MFYILNFKNHTFTHATCSEQVIAKIDSIIQTGAANVDDIEIVNAFDELCRMSVDQFKNNWL